MNAVVEKTLFSKVIGLRKESTEILALCEEKLKTLVLLMEELKEKEKTLAELLDVSMTVLTKLLSNCSKLRQLWTG